MVWLVGTSELTSIHDLLKVLKFRELPTHQLEDSSSSKNINYHGLDNKTACIIYQMRNFLFIIISTVSGFIQELYMLKDTVLETKIAEFANSLDLDEVAHNDCNCLPSSL